MTVEIDKIQLFWRSFEDLAPRLADIQSADDPTYDALLAKLHSIHSGLFLEFSVNGPHELVVTAEGDRDLFPLAHSIVGLAPRVPGWTFRALKPKNADPKTASWNNLVVEISSVYFEALETPSSEIGLRLFVAGISESHTEDAHNALLRALDHALGEERFANVVRFTEVCVLTPDQDREQLTPLSDIDEFIVWLEERRASAS
jgi:hypothetical protein